MVMKTGPSRRLIVAILLAVALAASASIVVSAHGHVSILGAIARDATSYAMKELGWSADSTADDVLVRMTKYQKRGRYDDAIKAGVAWTEKHPHDESNILPLSVYWSISDLYLEKAKSESGRADKYVRQAIVYRDKAPPVPSYDVLDLLLLASFSESAGDLSPRQRCAEYRNAIGILQRAAAENEKVAQAASQASKKVGPERTASTRHWIKGRSEGTDAAIDHVKVKLHDSGCQYP